MASVPSMTSATSAGGRRRLVALSAVLCATVFVADLALPPASATGVIYVVPLLVGLWRESARFTAWLAAVCAVLVVAAGVAGAFLHTDLELQMMLTNRALALFAIGVAARLAQMRLVQEKELESGRKRFVTTLESIADAVVSTGPDGRVNFLNPVAERLTGWTRAEGVGRPVTEVCVFNAVEDEPAAQGEDPAERRSIVMRARLRTRDGRHLPVEGTRARVAPKKDGEPTGANVVLVFRDASRRERYERTLEELAYRDSLTGLPNRASLHDRLELELAHARRNGERLALLFLDLDGFKGINDSLGHDAGDALLCGVAERLRQCLREDDTVARLGGDEFTVVLPKVAGPRAAALVAEKIVAALQDDPVPFEGRPLAVSPSIGIALFPEHGPGSELLRHADAAMYAAKAAGGGCWRFHRDGGPTEATREADTAARESS